jgi:translin
VTDAMEATGAGTHAPPAAGDTAFAEFAEAIRARLDTVDSAREFAYAESRLIVRASASAIRKVHRGEYEAADAQMAETAASVAELLQRTEGTSLGGSGFVADAIKEHVEAVLTGRLARELPLPTPEEMGVPDPAYLNGMAEAISELRRHLVDLIRVGAIEEVERKLSRLDDLYFVLVTFDYPDAVSLGLKRRLDSVRPVLERTRSDFVTAARQASLERRMASLEERLPR